MFAHFLFTHGANTSQKQLGKLETCRLCGMAYIKDNEEDRRRHDTHCKVCTVLSLT
jgi:CRISPR/Cas system-associated protein Cas10 (large subunit of type III CRISPR-Cas system)